MSSPVPRAAPDATIPSWREERLAEARFEVWIDQDLCTGDGICEDVCPDVFVILEDGIAYVREADRVMNDPGGHTSVARVPIDDEEAVVSAAQGCPGECIFISVREARAAA